MTDSYLSISRIANDGAMTERLRACAAQQQDAGSIAPDVKVEVWVLEHRYAWASSPSWGEKWDSALVTHEDDPAYQPGADPAVITDGDILATVQALLAEEGTE